MDYIGEIQLFFNVILSHYSLVLKIMEINNKNGHGASNETILKIWNFN